MSAKQLSQPGVAWVHSFALLTALPALLVRRHLIGRARV
jgi:hypothetical protein